MVTRILILALLSLLSAPAWAQTVTYDTDTTSTNDTDTTDSFSHTIGTGANVLVGACVSTSGGGAVTGMQINGGAASFVVAADTSGSGGPNRMELWVRAVGSTNGAVTIAPTVTSADPFRTTAFSMFGVDQATPIGTPDQNVAVGTSVSKNVSSAAGELVISCLSLTTSVSAITVGAGQTEQWVNTVDANNTNEQGSTEPGDTTVTMSHSWTGASFAALVVAPVRAALDSQPAHLRGGTIPGMNSLGLGGPLP